VIIKLLYVALVVCVIALLVVAAAGYMRVKRHLEKPHPPETQAGRAREQK
jgi:hypothetical protein